MSTSPSATELFSAVDQHGHTIALRCPDGDDLLCGGCAAALFATLEDDEDALTPLPEHDDELSAQVEQDAADWAFGEDMLAELASMGATVLSEHDGPFPELTTGSEDTFQDPAGALFPGSGMAGHSCADSFHSPVWLIADPTCGRSQLEHFAVGGEDDDCRCGLSNLYEVLEALPGADGQRALEAHTAAMNELYDHMMAAESLIDGQAVDQLVDVACLACMTDPDYHASELDDELSDRTLQLATALRAFDVTMTLGARRPAGPVAQ